MTKGYVFTVVLLATSAYAQSITLGPGSVLRYSFTVNASAWGANVPDVLQFGVYGAAVVSPTPATLNAGLYNGSNLLGSVSAAPMSSTDLPRLVPLYWSSRSSLWTTAPFAAVDFTSILNGSIQGYIDLSATGGTVVIPPPVGDPPANTNCCISLMYRGPDGTRISIPGAITNVTQSVVSSPSALSIATTSPLTFGTTGSLYSQALVANGGITPYKNWALTAGMLPPGVSLTNSTKGIQDLLSGVPTASGIYLFTMQVTDAADTTFSAQFSLTINLGRNPLAVTGVVNAASYAGGGVAPGEVVMITGTGWGPSALAGLQLDDRGYVGTSVSGVQVLFDGIGAPLIYVQAGQLSAVVPYAVAGETSTQIQVSYYGQSSDPVAVPVTAVVPGVFTMDASGRGPGAVVNQNGTVNSPDNPASAGAYISVFATGEGQTSPGGVDGKLGGAPAPRPIQPVTATIRGVNAPVQYAGGVTGLVAGVIQVNLQVPPGITPGSGAPLVLNIGGQTSQQNVTVAVQ